MSNTNIVFEDNTVQVKNLVESTARSFLDEIGGAIKSRAKRTVRRRTSQTAGSYDYKIDMGSHSVTIGSPSENAIWEEYGTGIHAINGDGRKTSWLYFDTYDGKWHRTKGKTATRPLFTAYTMLKSKIVRRAEQLFGGMSS